MKPWFALGALSAVALALLLIGLATYFGYQAVQLTKLDGPWIHYAAAELEVNLPVYLDMQLRRALVFAVLTISATVPVPSLLRIATSSIPRLLDRVHD